MSNVLNKLTKIYKKSVNTSLFNTDEWIINPDLTLVQDLDSKYWNIDGDTITPMSISEISAVNNTLSNLSTIRTQLKANIDAKTVYLISLGYHYDGEVFSMSGNARSYWENINMNRNNILMYPEDPISVSCQENNAYDLYKNKIDEFYLGGVLFVKGLVSSGRVLKTDINNLNTFEELNNFVDDRQ